jgi:hypothetical protein
VAIGDWMNDIGVQLAYTTLDGEGFESRRTLALQTSSPWGPEVQLRAHYRFSDLEGLSDFSGLSGRRHEAGARIKWTKQFWELGIEYRFDVNDYDDAALSARRHQLGLDLQRTLPGDWAILFAATRRNSRYDDESHGTEDRTELALAMEKTLSTRWRLVIRYAHTDNDADLAEFNYSGNRISAGVEAVM